MKSFKVVLVVFVLALAVTAYAQGPGWGGYYGGMGPGMMYGWGDGYGPGYGMGPGMMYGWGGYSPGMMGGYGGGYGMGPGMMYGRGGYGPGYGMGPGMMYGWGGYGPGYGRGPRSGYNQSEECKKFFDDTAKLRKELNSKRFEYFEAYRNPDAKPDTLAKLDREIRALRDKIHEKAPEEGCGW